MEKFCSVPSSDLLRDVGVPPVELIDKLIKKSSCLINPDRDDAISQSICNNFHQRLLSNILFIKAAFDNLTVLEKEEKADEIIKHLCLLYLQQLPITSTQPGVESTQDNVLIGSVADIVIYLLPYLSDISDILLIIDTCLKHLENDNIHVHQTEGEISTDQIKYHCILFLDTLLSGGLLVKLTAIFSDFDQKLLSSLLSVMRSSSIAICHQIAVLLLGLIQYGDKAITKAGHVWDFISSIWQKQVTVEVHALDIVLVLICCLHELFICSFSENPEVLSTLVDLRESRVFWDIIQTGLVDSDPLSRKRGMFLLHQALFSVHKTFSKEGEGRHHDEKGEGNRERQERGGEWKIKFCEGYMFWWLIDVESTESIAEWKEVQLVWEDIILLLETLEEKQVHIVKPVLVRLKSVMAASQRYINGHSLLHFSWLMVVLKRVFSHDSKSIVKLGVTQCLEMVLENSPVLLEVNWTFFFDPLLEVLSDTSIFARDDHSNQTAVCPPIAECFAGFMKQFISQLPNDLKCTFLTYFLTTLSLKNLPDIPMVYISYAISCVPSFTDPLMRFKALAAVRSLVSSCLLTHKTTHRAATQCFLLTGICKQIDTGLNVLEVFQTLGCFRSKECLVFGSSAWNKASDLIYKVATSRIGTGGTVDLILFLQSCVKSLPKTEPVEVELNSQSELNAVSLSPQVLARAILLTVSAELDNTTSFCKGQSLVEILTSLLSPVMDTITGARTRLYMSIDSLISAVDLLNNILQLLLEGAELLKTPMDITSGVGHLLYTVLLPWLPDILSYLEDALLRGYQTINASHPSFEHVLLYKSALNCVYQVMNLNQFKWTESRDSRPYLIAKTAFDVLLKVEKKEVTLTSCLFGAVSALEWVCGLLNDLYRKDDASSLANKSSNEYVMSDFEEKEFLSQLCMLPINLVLIKPIDVSSNQNIPEQNGDYLKASRVVYEYGPIISYCISLYWKCILYALQHRYDHVTLMHGSCDPQVTSSLLRVGSDDMDSIAELCVEQMDIFTDDLGITLLCLAALVPKMDVSTSLYHIETIWPLVMGTRDDLKTFMNCLSSFLKVAFHFSLLASNDTKVIDLQMKYIDEIHVVAQVKEGIYNLLIKHVCDIWQSQFHHDPDSVVQSIRKRESLLIQACTFGPIFKKNLRMINDVDQFIKSLNDSCSSNAIKWRDPESDIQVRVYLLSFFMELVMASDVNSVYMDALISSVIITITNTLKQMTENKPRYYVNSLSHRVRLRLIQTLLLFYQWADESTARMVVMTMWECLETDNQLSVRYGMEWMTILLYHQYPNLWEETLLPQLKMNTGKRLSRFCSVFTVAMHLGKCFQSKHDKSLYYSKVFPLIFQWCLCHHFVVRLYAAGSVLEMWKDCSQLLEDLPQFVSLKQYIEFIEQYSDTTKSRKLETNVFFSHFRPLNDYCVQVIFHILPALTNVLEEEWIQMETFQNASLIWSNESLSLPMLCTSRTILDLYEKNLRPSEKSGQETVQQLEIAQMELSSEILDGGNVQKKITPWTNSPEILKELFPEVHPSSNVGKKHGGLILVASLLHKPPNLGGLCRTCEIFGVAEIVISSSKILDEKEFKSLSVTAEKWVKITEVKPDGLKEYLLMMRKRGHTLVGVEQTAQSKCVTSYNFPLKTVLVLGMFFVDYPDELLAKVFVLPPSMQRKLRHEGLFSEELLHYLSLEFIPNLFTKDYLIQLLHMPHPLIDRHPGLTQLTNEREGIPVELIHLLNDCIEIPQIGIIRSLNVHVCGALIIWEYTKQHLLKY